MSSLVVILRRSLWLVAIAAGGGAAWGWYRDRVTDDGLAPAEWPPIAEPATAASTSGESGTSGTASFVNALVDAPEARSADRETGGWVDALDDGSCPLSHPVKANDNSGIFHVPGGRFYDRTKPERCYTSADAAVADGYRQAKN